MEKLLGDYCLENNIFGRESVGSLQELTEGQRDWREVVVLGLRYEERRVRFEFEFGF